jgi:hypothetical protein
VARDRYEEANFKRLEPPSKKKKGDGEKKKDEDDAGWETGGAKKKTAGKKTPAPMTFPGFSPKVADMLSQCHEAGIVSKGELDERVMEDLKALPERGTSLAPHVKAAHASFCSSSSSSSSASSPPPLHLLLFTSSSPSSSGDSSSGDSSSGEAYQEALAVLPPDHPRGPAQRAW